MKRIVDIRSSKQGATLKPQEHPDELDSFTYRLLGANESKAISSQALIEKPDFDFHWLVEGLIAYGAITLFSAHPKTGKTTFLYYLLRAVLENKPFLNRAVEFEGNILVLSEEGYQILKLKLSDLGLGSERFLLIQRSEIKGWIESLAQIELHVRLFNVRFAVIDTLWSFWNIKDENNAAAIMGPFQAFQQIVQKNKIAGLIIHHLRKSDPDSSGSAVRGSSAIAAAVDFMLEMGRDVGTRRKLDIQGRCVFEEKISIELKDDEYIFLGSASDFSSDSVMSRALEFLTFRAGEQYDPEALRQALNPRPGLTTTRNVLEQLFKDGKVVKTGEAKKGSRLKYCVQKPPKPLLTLEAAKKLSIKIPGAVKKTFDLGGGAK